MPFFFQEIVLFGITVGHIIVDCICGKEYTEHKTDIEVGNYGYCKGDGIKLVLSFIYKLFHTENDEGQEEKNVDPH